MSIKLHPGDFVPAFREGLAAAIARSLHAGRDVTLKVSRSAPRLDKWEREILIDQVRLGTIAFRRRLEGK